MINTQTQIDSLIDLAVIQRTELKQLIESLPQLRDHLSSEIERNLEEIEPAIRSELEQFVAARALDTQAKTSAELSAKLDAMARNLESTTAAKYSVLMAERAENANLLAKAEARIEDAASMLSHAVKEIVTDELSRFPRAGEIDQLRKEFAEPRGLNPRGRWQVGETYNKLDLVSYNGDSYVSSTDGNREKPSRSSEAWTLSAARGNGGAGGGVTSMTDLVPVPSNGEILIGNGSAFVNATLTAGTGISISNGPGSITINATDGNITLDDGTAAAPSLNFTNEPTTGLFRASSNVMGFAVAGTSRATMTATGMTVTGTITPSGSVHAAAGSVGNPSLAFNTDQNTGLYHIGADNIGVAAGGAKVLDIATTGLTVTGALGATSLTAPATTNLTLTGGSTGASLVLGQGASGNATLVSPGTFLLYNTANTTGLANFITFGANNRARIGGIIEDSTTGAEAIRLYSGNTASGAVERARISSGGNLLIGGTTDISGNGGLKVFGTTAASSTGSGALQVAGGVGVAGAGYFGGALNVRTDAAGQGAQAILDNRTTTGLTTLWFTEDGVASKYSYLARYGSTNGSKPSLNEFGVVGGGNWSFAQGTVKVSDTTSASSSTVGALTIGNGTATTNVAIGGGNVNAGGTLTVGGAATFAGAVTVGSSSGITSAGNLTLQTATDSRINFIAGQTAWLNYNLAADRWTFRHTTSGVTSLTLTEAASTFAGKVTVSSTTAGSAGAGALVVSGGLATGAASYFGGNVGIGIAGSAVPLDVQTTGSISSVNSVFRLTTTANNSSPKIQFFGKQGSGVTALESGAIQIVQTVNSDNLGKPRMGFLVGDAGTISEKVSIDYLGNVGIGTTTPATKLDVNGAATFAGAVAINNTTAAAVAAPSTHKVSILIGGVQYYLLASNV